jgi:hypothetical protein
MDASLPTRIKAYINAMETSQFTFNQKARCLRLCHQLGTLCLPCFGILRELVHFQKRGENVNSASYCEVMLKLHDAIRRKIPGQLARRILLHRDNARLHTAVSRNMSEGLADCSWSSKELGLNKPGLVWSSVTSEKSRPMSEKRFCNCSLIFCSALCFYFSTDVEQ